MQTLLVKHYQRKLNDLKSNLEAYEKEADLWLVDSQVTNSAGNLALHLVGNLNHFIGHGLGDTGYVRDRPAEFNSKDVPRALILQQIDATSAMIAEVVPKVDLDATYPQDLYNRASTNADFLVHALEHLNYHLGQINYHRRLLCN